MYQEKRWGRTDAAFSSPPKLAIVTAEPIELRVHSISFETDTVRLVELRDPLARSLAAFTPGAHIDLSLPGGITRSYSLIGDPTDRIRYVLGVHRDANSRGGSRIIHEDLRVGALVRALPPVNDFPLVEDARDTILIAGGIGITPLLTMAERLDVLSRGFTLHYGARDRASTPFLERLARLGKRVHLAFSRAREGHRLDVAGIVASAAPDAELYCCGPAGMLDAFATATSSRDPGRLHVEYFAATEPAAVEGGFTVVLARSGRSVSVPPGKTILEALIDAGLEPASSCMEGVCGTCETRVIEGVPDHRDRVLNLQERAANKTMMLCCSGSKSERLVLDM